MNTNRDARSEFHTAKKNKAKEDKKKLLENIRSIIIAALSLTVALGFNKFIISVQESFPKANTPIGSALFFLFMFIAILAILILLDADFKK